MESLLGLLSLWCGVPLLHLLDLGCPGISFQQILARGCQSRVLAVVAPYLVVGLRQQLVGCHLVGSLGLVPGVFGPFLRELELARLL